MDQCKKWSVRKKFMIFFSKWFSLYTTLPPRDQCEVSIIQFVPKSLHQTLVNFTVSSPGYWQAGCLWWEAVESWFHLHLKSFFALKHNFRGFLLGRITRWINVIYESRMKWTWHHSQVCFSWGKFPPQTQNGTPSTIPNEAVGMRDLDVMLLWVW